MNKVKKSFSLIELIIVILLINILYFFYFSNYIFKLDFNKKLKLNNIKIFLLDNYPFSKSLEFLCIKEDFKCFIIKDGSTIDTYPGKNIFKTTPQIYEYNKKYEKKYLDSLKNDNYYKDIIFRLIIDEDFKSNEFILETNNQIYVFNSIYTKPLTYKTLTEYYKSIENNKQRVFYAF